MKMKKLCISQVQLRKTSLSIYLRRLEEEIRLRRILNDFLEIVHIGMTVEAEVCSQQIGARVVGDLEEKEQEVVFRFVSCCSVRKEFHDKSRWNVARGMF
jgi:transcriptional regulator NrdR family protein